MIALAYTIARTRKAYYCALERNNKDIEITYWLVYFAETINQAQANTIKRVNFSIAKASLYELMLGKLNERQEKVIARIFREGIDGFRGDLSAENYITITKTSRARYKGLASPRHDGRGHEDGRASSHLLSPESGADQRLSPMQDANISAPHRTDRQERLPSRQRTAWGSARGACPSRAIRNAIKKVRTKSRCPQSWKRIATLGCLF